MIQEKIKLLSTKLQNREFLRLIKSKIEEILGGNFTLGAEIEFYLSENINIQNLEFFLGKKLIKERGENQYEFHIGPYEDPEILVQKISEFCENLKKKFQGDIYFNSKPRENDYGNALQIQLGSDSKIFQENIEFISSCFCEFAPKTFLAYAPTIECYKRFSEEYIAPTHISYGMNNRTCLVRIVPAYPKRIEIRSGSNNAEIYVLISTICASLYRALTGRKREKKYIAIYGNSYDPQYKLEKLPSNLEEAICEFDESFYDI